jgi:hypothetical protein
VIGAGWVVVVELVVVLVVVVGATVVGGTVARGRVVGTVTAWRTIVVVVATTGTPIASTIFRVSARIKSGSVMYPDGNRLWPSPTA